MVVDYLGTFVYARKAFQWGVSHVDIQGKSISESYARTWYAYSENCVTGSVVFKNDGRWG